MNQYKILILDRSSELAQQLSQSWELNVANCPGKDVLTLLDQIKPDLLLLDYNEETSLLLQRIMEVYPGLRVIALAQHATTTDAVKALKLGCVDFILRDISDPELKQSILTQLEEEKQRECVVEEPWFFGQSAALSQMFEEILEWGRSDNLILLGPCGAGKRRVAEIINRTFAPKHKKLISINLSLFPQETRETYFWGTLRDVLKI
ncbi:MAG: response regulator [Candidatus Margulisiibacteriota bacterium]|jgi:DNA-binding NtrC family response regulator